MKKTSLLLAVGALLYGTASVYAEGIPNITANMSSEALSQLIEQIGDVPPDSSEGAEDEYPDNTDGLEPPTPPPFPSNVSVDSSSPKRYSRMCDPDSFKVINGAVMAEFPVTVNGEEGVWGNVGNKTVVKGTGWILILPPGDTWNSSWRFVTDGTVAITSILLEPLLRDTSSDPVGQKKVYTFDIGGLLPRAPVSVDGLEHTVGSARGRVIKQTSPTAPSPIFTAIYSNPVYIGTHSEDGNTIPPDTSPTHDLYGTLKITFNSDVEDLLIDPGFAYIADTDCILPVTGASVSANLLTLYGKGLVYVSANGSLLPGVPAFEVLEDGVNTFDISDLIAKLHAGVCYSLVNEGALGTNIPLEVNGVDMPDGKVCP